MTAQVHLVLTMLVGAGVALPVDAQGPVVAAPGCGVNPGNQSVTRADGSSYAYFGRKCIQPTDCGQCHGDETCTCSDGCCRPHPGPPGYVCLPNATDIAGAPCNVKAVGAGKTVTQLAELCSTTPTCRGFNTNGYLKRCVRNSCGAHPVSMLGHADLISCLRTDTPTNEKADPEWTGTACKASPSPSPPAARTPYGSGCATTADRPSCNCSGVHPPFGAPVHELKLQADYHFPTTEADEFATLTVPELVSIKGTSAVLHNPATQKTATLAIGQQSWGWELLHVSDNGVVIEHDFAEWSQLQYLWSKKIQRSNIAVRKPVGWLETISQPLYDMHQIDPDYHCKQDIDPTDWMGRLAANISGGEESTIEAANTLMAPETDSGLFGNPEDLNKFVLTHRSELHSMPWGGHGPGPAAPPGTPKPPPPAPAALWKLEGSQYLPAGCKNVSMDSWDQVKLGMVGEHLRAVNQGMWSSTAGCGVEIIAVSPGPLPGASDVLPPERVAGGNSSRTTALLRISSQGVGSNSTNTSYLRATVGADWVGLLDLANLGQNGTEFFAALLAQIERWTSFIERGAKVQLPQADRRYRATANALLTMYMNTDRGLIPQYGAGQFWNTYNIYLPLDTLALGGALLEWGHHEEALNYLRYFFTTKVCTRPTCFEPLPGHGNISYGEIDYDIFGCDSDADYGRLIDLFVQAVRYSENITWAKEVLPAVQAMASNVVARRAAAVAAYSDGHPFHGIVPGSPEHDICGAPSFFFSINVWFVRGLLSLDQLHKEFPALTLNASLEAKLLPIATAWRADIRAAANFTAVRRTDGNGLYFLHPVVGAAYQQSAEPQEGGDESTCVARGTCFASMTAGLPGGGSNQHTNYANFRIFSETLLAGVLDSEFELAIMEFRESHRGTLLGMTRFRDVLDDMPILGYGRSSLAHDRLYSFHNTLAGHSLNYISRGSYWGTEQRQQLDYGVGNRTGIVNNRWRNDCGVGGEDCSLCMVSGVASAYWIRWMFVSDDPDTSFVYIARGAPRRWYSQTAEPFGIEGAPTRFGKVSYEIQAQSDGSVRGAVALDLRKGSVQAEVPLVAIKIRASNKQSPLKGHLELSGAGTEMVAWHATNETVVVRFGLSTKFNFSAS